jgi:hypothetical protein
MNQFEISEDSIEDGVCTEYAVYNTEGDYFGSFATYAEAEQFIIEG